jgi:hypothetical protein
VVEVRPVDAKVRVYVSTFAERESPLKVAIELLLSVLLVVVPESVGVKPRFEPALTMAAIDVGELNAAALP